MVNRKLSIFKSSVKVYNAFCVRCRWKGISYKLITDGELPDQCSRCHQRGTLRSNQS